MANTDSNSLSMIDVILNLSNIRPVTHEIAIELQDISILILMKYHNNL